MATGIEWTDTTWNPVAGCTSVSPGCRNCYAARIAYRLQDHPNESVAEKYRDTARLTGDGRPVFTGGVNLVPRVLREPLRWRKPRRVFVNSMSDLFHEEVPEWFLDRIFGVMVACPDHRFQILTKRPERMADYLRDPRDDLGGRICQAVYKVTGKDPGPAPDWPLPNVWVGTSVEDQERADERVPHLLRTVAAVRFLSCEPLLGPVDLSRWLRSARTRTHPGSGWDYRYPSELHWIIVGGESGPRARTMVNDWARSLVDQAREVGVAPFVKQLGTRPGLRDPKGGDPEEWPEDLRVREFPEVAPGAQTRLL